DVAEVQRARRGHRQRGDDVGRSVGGGEVSGGGLGAHRQDGERSGARKKLMHESCSTFSKVRGGRPPHACSQRPRVASGTAALTPDKPSPIWGKLGLPRPVYVGFLVGRATKRRRNSPAS